MEAINLWPTAKSSLLPAFAHRLVLENYDFIFVCGGECLGEFSGSAIRAEQLCHGAYVLQSLK